MRHRAVVAFALFPWTLIPLALGQVVDFSPLVEKLPWPRETTRSLRQAGCAVACPDVIEQARLAGAAAGAAELSRLCTGGQPPGIGQRALWGYVSWASSSAEEARRIFSIMSHRPNGWPGHAIGYVVPPHCGGAEVPINYVWQTDAERMTQAADMGCFGYSPEVQP